MGGGGASVHLAPLAEKQRPATLLVSLAEEAIPARNYPLAVGNWKRRCKISLAMKPAVTLLETARQKRKESEQVAQARKLMIEKYESRGAIAAITSLRWPGRNRCCWTNYGNRRPEYRC